MATSRSGAGGKIVTNRRKQRLAATPYDRPPPQQLPPPPPKSPNWFTGIIVPSARALATGAGKIFSSIFSESESSSSEDEDSASEDDIDNDNHYEIPYNGVNTLNEKNVTSPVMMRYEQESQLMWRSETKRIIEQLITKETFSREECDRLIKVLNSRVMDWSMEAGEKSSVAGSPGKTVDHEDVDIYNKAVQEAKKWFQEKKVGPNSVTQLAQVETGGGSPADVARSYMKDRPPWASPGRNVELRTPLTATMKLFKEGTLYSAGHDSMSSSKKRSSLASRSWNIQEELQRVRSRATEDMLRSPSSKTDPSLSAVAKIRVESEGAGEEVFAMGERMAEPESLRRSKPVDALVDAGVSSAPALAALEPRQDGKASEALSSKPATSVSGNNEVSKAVLADAECPASKPIHPSSPKHAEEQQAALLYMRESKSSNCKLNGAPSSNLSFTDPHLSKVNGSPATEVTEFGGKECVNGLSSPSQVSLSAGVAMGQNYEQNGDENHNADNVNEKPVNIINMEGNCELLSEAYMEVPIVTETNSIASGSQNSLGVQYEELSVDMAQPSPKEKVGIMAGKQQGRKPGKYNRKSRGRGK